MKNIILFDVDHTLINTDQLRKNTTSVLMKYLGVNKKTYINAQLIYLNKLKSSSDFHPEKYCHFLSEYFKFNYKILEGVFYKNQTLYSNVLFSDVQTTLGALSNKYSLGIYSEGIVRFQITKLKFGGILSYFDINHIYIFRRKVSSKSIDKLPHGSMVVDDKTSVVNELLKYKNFHPILIIRDRYRDKTNNTVGQRVVNSLTEINSMLSNK